MAIDFPNSPTVGQIFTSGDKSWIWDGTVWKAYGASLSPTVLKVDSTNSRVGINNQSPATALDVTGAITVSGNVTVDTNTFFVDATNNRVGVANLGPLVALDVNETVAVRNNTGSDGVAIKARSAGTSYYLSTLTPTTLTANRTLTLPDATGTVALTTDPGLQLVKTQTVGSAVASVTVTDAFSSTFDAYRIQIFGINGSTVTDMKFTLGSTSTGYYGSYYYDLFNGLATGTARYNNAANTQVGGVGTSAEQNAHFDIFNPNKTARTSWSGNWYGNGYSGWFSGVVDNATAYTAFTLTPVAGTFTGGTIKVFGYRN